METRSIKSRIILGDMKITKHFDTIKKAENYLNKLYSKYDNVKLLSFPISGEKGIYVFLVNN